MHPLTKQAVPCQSSESPTGTTRTEPLSAVVS